MSKIELAKELLKFIHFDLVDVGEKFPVEWFRARTCEDVRGQQPRSPPSSKPRLNWALWVIFYKLKETSQCCRIFGKDQLFHWPPSQLVRLRLGWRAYDGKILPIAYLKVARLVLKIHVCFRLCFNNSSIALCLTKQKTLRLNSSLQWSSRTRALTANSGSVSGSPQVSVKSSSAETGCQPQT